MLVPEAAGVLSALGLALSDERRDDGALARRARWTRRGELPDEGEADIRYLGQSFELTVPLGGDVAEAFHRAHEERYGYADRSGRSSSSRCARRTCARAQSTCTPMHRLVPPRRGSSSSTARPRGSRPGWRGEWRDGSLVVTRT